MRPSSPTTQSAAAFTSPSASAARGRTAGPASSRAPTRREGETGTRRTRTRRTTSRGGAAATKSSKTPSWRRPRPPTPKIRHKRRRCDFFQCCSVECDGKPFWCVRGEECESLSWTWEKQLNHELKTLSIQLWTLDAPKCSEARRRATNLEGPWICFSHSIYISFKEMRLDCSLVTYAVTLTIPCLVICSSEGLCLGCAQTTINDANDGRLPFGTNHSASRKKLGHCAYEYRVIRLCVACDT